MGQIDMFKNYSYSIGQYAKKPPKKQLHKKYKYERLLKAIPKLIGIK